MNFLEAEQIFWGGITLLTCSYDPLDICGLLREGVQGNGDICSDK